MNGKIDMIVDGGAVGIGVESTIIDVSGGEPVILRPGALPRKWLLLFLVRRFLLTLP